MGIQTLVDDVNKALPTVNALIDAFDPAAAGAVNAAEGIIAAGEAMAAKKASYTLEAWAANAALVNQGDTAIQAAEDDAAK